MNETYQPSSLPNSPLESLVMYQLNELVRGKNLIEKQYAQLRKTRVSRGKASLLAAEIADLDRRADRLSRLMAAMA
jgi:hypothetical protein